MNNVNPDKFQTKDSVHGKRVHISFQIGEDYSVV